MAEKFLNFPKELQRDILAGAESRLNVKPYILEKDLWICWILQELFTLSLPMAFKGGTSLSKVYNLINRFSEDIDITIDYRHFSPSTDLTKPISRTALDKLSEHLKREVAQYTQKTVLPFLQERLQNEFPKTSFTLDLSEDGEQLRIHYPSLFEKEVGYLKNNVFLEFGGRNSTEPHEIHVIKTTLSNAHQDMPLPIAKVKVLSPLRTFWEKATLIHVECHRGRLNQNAERLSRHWYDLAKLSQSWVGQKALSDRILLEDVVLHKKAFFRAGYANYDQCIDGRFRLVPNTEELHSLKTDYIAMQNAGMFFEIPASFEDLTEVIQKLEVEINK